MSQALVSVVQATVRVAGAGDDLETAIADGLTVICDGCGVDVAIVSGRALSAAPGETVLYSAVSDLSLQIRANPVPPELGTALMAFADATTAARERAVKVRASVNAADDKMRRRNAVMRSLFDVLPVGIVLIEPETRIVIKANAAFLGFGDWSLDAVVGQDFFQLIPEGDHHVPVGALAQLAQTSQFGPVEHAFQRPDGGLFPAVVRGTVQESGLGKRMICVLVEDVSRTHTHLAEIQEAHDLAFRAQDQLHSAVQALPYGFMLFDASDRLVIVNDQMRAIYPELSPHLDAGLTYAQMLRMGADAGLFPDALGREGAYVAQIMRLRAKPLNDCLVRLNSGRLIRVLDRATPDGGRVGLRIDVTDQDDVARRLGDVIAGSQAGTWEVDLVSGENIVNDRWFNMLGLRREDFEEITSDVWKTLIHADDRAEVLDSVARMIRGDIVHYEHTYRMGGVNGRWVWITDRGRISAWAPDGTPTRMAGVHFDISALKETEERLEQIIQGAEAGTWQFDVSTGTNRINDRWAEIIGHTRSELEPMTPLRWKSLVHPDDLHKLHLDRERRFAIGDWFFNQELRLRHKTGHWVWVQSRGQVTAWNDNGAPSLMSGVHLDISARKQLEDDLKAERDFMVTLTETSVSGIMAVDADAHIVFLNPEAVAILETPAEALIGLVCDPAILRLSDEQGGVITLDDMPCRMALASSMTKRDIRLRLAMPDGRTKVLSINAAPLPDTGIKARVVCTITDMTASAEAEDILRRATDRAEAANRAKSQFLANMSHELRTPLNGVLGMADLLIDGQSADQTRAMAQTIRDSGTLLLSILNDILDLAKIESGKLALADEVCSIADLARRVKTMHTLDARAKGVTFGLHLGPGMEEPRRGDPQRLLQVLHNLVGNAVKFTETGSVELWIDAVGDEVRLVVRDTGIGMTPDQAAVVFDEFTQADGSITRRFGGTGLGLPIVRRLVQLMDGQITLTTSLGQGTEVSVRLSLPLAVAVRAPDAAADRPDFIGLRALVAEDNATNRMILRAMLGRLGISATMVEDGDEAVLAYDQGRFDLLLLDISMPRKDGVSALAEMRSRPGALPPAIAVTANAMTHLVESYHAAGFDEVVAKPVRLAALAAAILRVCPAATLASDVPPDAVIPEAGSRPCPRG
jgi:PAS domain S-box-containing protein